MTVKILIGDKNETYGREVASALRQQKDIEISATVGSREAAIRLADNELDILLISPELMNGHALTRFVQAAQLKAPRVRVMYLLDAVTPDEDIISDIKGGMRGYIRKGDSAAAMSKAIRAVHNGEIWAERRILEKAISQPMLLPETLRSHAPGMPTLTSREREMLTLVLQGASNREIANKSSISERTVKTHLYRVYKKLNVKSRTKAIALLSHA
jgi:two-component system nitrate/nitrite response regulator NarL